MRLESSRTRRTPTLLSEPGVVAALPLARQKKAAKPATKKLVASQTAAKAHNDALASSNKPSTATSVEIGPYAIVGKVVWRGNALGVTPFG